MWKLGEICRPRAIELLSERLAFSRTSGEMYDAVLGRLLPRGGPYDSLRGHLRVIREEKKAQEEWLAESLRSLGADPGAPDNSLLLREEWTNIAAALTGDTEPAQLFEALLRAEVYDSGGWESLVDLAAQAGDNDALDDFRQRLHEEQEHFVFVGRIVSRFTRGEILDEHTNVLAEDPR